MSTPRGFDSRSPDFARLLAGRASAGQAQEDRGHAQHLERMERSLTAAGPDSEVRFLPDEVIFTPGTRAGLAFVLEALGVVEASATRSREAQSG